MLSGAQNFHLIKFNLAHRLFYEFIILVFIHTISLSLSLFLYFSIFHLLFGVARIAIDMGMVLVTARQVIIIMYGKWYE